MTRRLSRTPLRTGPLAEMAESIEQHSDSVMRAEKLNNADVIIIGAGGGLGDILSLRGEIEVGFIERFRYIIEPKLELMALDRALMLTEDTPTIKRAPDAAMLRRAVRVREKALRKTMPRGRR